MKRLLTSLLLVTLACSFVLAQSPTYGFTYDGQGQYFFNPTPLNMDLNGSEVLVNGTFESVLGAVWLSIGNHTGTRSNVDPQSGTWNVSVIATGRGDNSSNAFYSGFTPTSVLGNKVTYEFWAKSDSGNTTLHCDITGAQSFSDSVTITGTWTKFAFNKTFNTTGGSRFIVFYLSGAGGFRLDNVSLTQAYDGLWAAWIKTSNAAGNQRFFSKRTATGWLLFTAVTTGLYKGLLQSDGTSITATSSTAITDGRWHFISMTADRTGNLSLYVDGILDGTPQSISAFIGKVILSDDLRIGMDDGLYLNGSLGEMIFVRYPTLPTGIASWIAYAARQKKIPMPPLTGGGEIVGWWDWSSGGGYDKSGTGNHLTKTGVGGRIVVSAPNQEIQP